LSDPKRFGAENVDSVQVLVSVQLSATFSATAREHLPGEMPVTHGLPFVTMMSASVMRARSKVTAVKRKTPVPRNGATLTGRTGKWLAGDAEWETSKASRRNLSHAAAVTECAHLTTQALRWSAMASVTIDLDQVLAALTAKKVPFVLRGAHGISGWTGRPHATRDIDILVKAGRNYARAVVVIRGLFPQLEARRFAGVTGFFPPGETESVIDVTYPHRPDNAETLRTAIWVDERN
jgi:hypothetical protein